MKTAYIALLFVFISVISSFAGTDPTVSTRINTVGDFKEYVYTLTNDLDSGETVYRFLLLMPESAALTVSSFTTSKTNWKVALGIRDGIGTWGCYSGPAVGILPGQVAVFRLVTPISVPTSYTYKPPVEAYTSNWSWGPFGESLLPVPVPEPGSFVGLAAGLVPVGFGLARRRRKN